MPAVESLKALEILDSRGRPTIQATCRFQSGAAGTASVPSGASTGAAEALELRDGDLRRFGGFGCRQAVTNVNVSINRAVAGHRFSTQEAFDHRLLDLDGTENKRNLGANAILAASIAFARACAAQQQIPLYQYLSHLLVRNMDREEPTPMVDRVAPRLPRLTVNLFSGGKHAGGQVAIQDLLVVPASAATIDESLAMVYAVYQSAADLCRKKFQARALTADEGGLAPSFRSVDEMLSVAVEAIAAAGYQPGGDVALALDVASSHFFENGCYHMDGRVLSSLEMINLICQWLEKYPIVSVEDGLAEEDWEYWPILRQRVASKALVLGDDLLCTNPVRIKRAVGANAANALLLKVNQIGTLSEAAEALQLARQARWSVTVSARSGETEDNWLADLAVGWSGDQIKVGSVTQSERLSKYNRLLEIENCSSFPLNPWPRVTLRD